MELDVSKGYLQPDESIEYAVQGPFPSQTVLGQEVSFDEVFLSGKYTVMDHDTVLLEGELNTTAHSRCARCLSPVSVPIHVDFHEEFQKEPDDNAQDVFLFDKKALPLDAMIQTLILLELPLRFECEGGCDKALDISEMVKDGDTVTHPEQGGTQEESTYRPFENLGKMLESQTKH